MGPERRRTWSLNNPRFAGGPTLWERWDDPLLPEPRPDYPGPNLHRLAVASTQPVVREVFTLTRAPDTVGLRLREAKDLLAAVQHTVVEHQVSTALSAQIGCPACGIPRRHKDSRRIVGAHAVRRAASG